MRYVNLGCGATFHPAWINIDMVARGPSVIKHDLAKGIPIRDSSADAVYHTAMLEHLRRADASGFMKECHRILKVGGVIRVGVPDSERICRLYLEKLDAASAGDREAANDYDWIMLELCDQMVREASGGEMLAHLEHIPHESERFVLDRIGQEGEEILRAIRAGGKGRSPKDDLSTRIRGVLRRIRNEVLKLLAGQNAVRALEIGRFRMSGEVHFWMYDRFSLARLLIEAGFKNPTLRPPGQSSIPGWSEFRLDVTPAGHPRKPDLFFMEAVKG